jgi:hypothetical protein
VRRLALLLLALPSIAWARIPVHVETVVRPDTVLIGQTVTLEWRVFLPDKSIVNFPARPADDSTAHWRSWTTTTLEPNSKGVREHRLTAEMQSFALGPVAIPGAPFRFRIPGEEVREGGFPTAGFHVGMTVPRTGPEPPLRGMKGLVPPPWWALVPWAWILGALALALIAFFLVRRWLNSRKAKPAQAAPEEALDPPGVEARRRLAALLAQRLPEHGRMLEHGTELADILRRFVERRFESPRPGYTTTELVRHLAARGDVAPEDVALLKGILDACDLTKFARRPYDLARAQSAETTAAALIDRWAAVPSEMPKAAAR